MESNLHFMDTTKEKTKKSKFISVSRHPAPKESQQGRVEVWKWCMIKNVAEKGDWRIVSNELEKKLEKHYQKGPAELELPDEEIARWKTGGSFKIRLEAMSAYDQQDQRHKTVFLFRRDLLTLEEVKQKLDEAAEKLE